MALHGNLYNETIDLTGGPAMFMWEWLDSRLQEWDTYGIFALDEGKKKKAAGPPLDLVHHLQQIVQHHGKDDAESKEAFRRSAQHLVGHPELAKGYAAAARHLQRHPRHAGGDPEGHAHMMRAGHVYGLNSAGEHTGQTDHFVKDARALLDKHNELVSQGKSGIDANHYNQFSARRMTDRAKDMIGHSIRRGEKAQAGSGGDQDDDDAPPPIHYGRSAQRATKERGSELLSKARRLGGKGAIFGGRGSAKTREDLRAAIERHLKDKYGDHRSFSHDDLDRLETHGSLDPSAKSKGGKRGGARGSGETAQSPAEREAETAHRHSQAAKVRKLLGMEPLEQRREREKENRERKEKGLPPKGRTETLPEPEVLKRMPMALKTDPRRRRDKGETEVGQIKRLSKEFAGKKPFPGRGESEIEVKKGKRKGEKDPTGISPDESEEEFEKRKKLKRAALAMSIRKARRGTDTKRGTKVPMDKLAGSRPVEGGKKGEREWDVPSKARETRDKRARSVLSYLSGREAQGELPHHMDAPKHVRDVKEKRRRQEVAKARAEKAGRQYRGELERVPEENPKELERRKALSQGSIAKAALPDVKKPEGTLSRDIMKPLRRTLRRELGGYGVSRPLPKEKGKEERRARISRPEPEARPERKKTVLGPREALKRMKLDTAERGAQEFVRGQADKARELEREKAPRRRRALEKRVADRPKPKRPESKGQYHMGDPGFQGSPAPRVRKVLDKKGEWTGHYTSRGVEQPKRGSTTAGFDYGDPRRKREVKEWTLLGKILGRARLAESSKPTLWDRIFN